MNLLPDRRKGSAFELVLENSEGPAPPQTLRKWPGYQPGLADNLTSRKRKPARGGHGGHDGHKQAPPGRRGFFLFLS
jgi:hypothetical protein